MKILAIGAKWLFVLSLPVLLLTASIAWAVNSSWLYKSGFERYDVSQTSGLAESELEKAAAGLISYFNSAEEYISLTVEKDGEPFELFKQREVVHLRDVKGLIRLDYQVLLGTLVYVLAYAGICLFRRRNWRRLARGVVGGSGIALGMIIALGVGSTIQGFGQLFTQFHFIAFTNELWMLDPTKDYLIMLFPQGFWYDTTLICAGITAGLAIILGGVSGGYLIYLRKKGGTPFADVQA